MGTAYKTDEVSLKNEYRGQELMRITTTDPMTGIEVTDTEKAPFVIEGRVPNLVDI